MSGILSQGVTQYFDSIGNPLAGGSVYFYAQGTTTFKNTWKDSTFSTLNSNPVVLDAAGTAVIWGSGAYTVVVKDALGNQISSSDVTAPGANSPIDVADWTALKSTTGINAGDVVLLLSGTLGTPETVQIVAAGTYATPDGSLVQNLTASGLQGVSTRWEFASFAEFIADVRTRTAGLGATIPSIGATYTAVTSGGNLGRANAGGQLWDVTTGAINRTTWWGPDTTGATDSYARLSAAYSACPDRSTLVFDADATFLLSQKLVFNNSVSVDFNNSTLLLNNSTSPNNHHFDVGSQLASAETWTETIAQNARTFALSGSTLAAGDYVAVSLGTDPYDATQPNWGRMCRVTANNGTSVSIDHAVPYAVNGTSHKIQKVTTLSANSTYKNVILDYVSGTTPDTSIFAGYGFGWTFENIFSKNSRIIINPYFCHAITARNITGTVTYGGVSSHGRALGMWQVEDSDFENINVVCNDNIAEIFIESWCRKIRITNAHLSTGASTTNSNVIQVTGGSYGVVVDGYDYEVNGQNNPISNGSNPGNWVVKNLRMNTYPKFLPLNKTESFADEQKSVDFTSQNTVLAEINVSMQPSWLDHGIFLCNGIVKNIWVYVSDKTYLSNLYVLNSSGQGSDFAPSLLSGVDVLFTQSYGSDYPFNDPAIPSKNLHFYTASGMVAGTECRIFVEFWPITSGAGAVFPLSATA